MKMASKFFGYVFFYFIYSLNQNEALLEVAKNNLRDGEVLTKILRIFNDTNSDGRLYDVTLKLLKSLCVCMKDTLKSRESNFNGSNNVFVEDKYHDSDVYAEIYNRTCLDLKSKIRKKLTKLRDFVHQRDTFDLQKGLHKDNTLKALNQIKSNQETNDNNLEILYKIFLETRKNHEYYIRKYSVLKQSLLPKNMLQDSIVIITLYPDKNKNFTKYNDSTSSDYEINSALLSNSLVDIDVIDMNFKKLSNTLTKTELASYCILQSIYVFLLNKFKNNEIKVFRRLRKGNTIKLYINFYIKTNHDDYTMMCCKNPSIELCKSINLQRNITNNINYNSGNISNNFEKNREPSYKKTISKIKNLFKIYNKEIKDDSITSVTYDNILNSYKYDVDCSTNLSLCFKTVIEENNFHPKSGVEHKEYKNMLLAQQGQTYNSNALLYSLLTTPNYDPTTNVPRNDKISVNTLDLSNITSAQTKSKIKHFQNQEQRYYKPEIREDLNKFTTENVENTFNMFDGTVENETKSNNLSDHSNEINNIDFGRKTVPSHSNIIGKKYNISNERQSAISTPIVLRKHSRMDINIPKQFNSIFNHSTMNYIETDAKDSNKYEVADFSTLAGIKIKPLTKKQKIEPNIFKNSIQQFLNSTDSIKMDTSETTTISIFKTADSRLQTAKKVNKPLFNKISSANEIINENGISTINNQTSLGLSLNPLNTIAIKNTTGKISQVTSINMTVSTQKTFDSSSKYVSIKNGTVMIPIVTDYASHTVINTTPKTGTRLLNRRKSHVDTNDIRTTFKSVPDIKIKERKNDHKSLLLNAYPFEICKTNIHNTKPTSLSATTITNKLSDDLKAEILDSHVFNTARDIFLTAQPKYIFNAFKNATDNIETRFEDLNKTEITKLNQSKYLSFATTNKSNLISSLPKKTIKQAQFNSKYLVSLNNDTEITVIYPKLSLYYEKDATDPTFNIVIPTPRMPIQKQNILNSSTNMSTTTITNYAPTAYEKNTTQTENSLKHLIQGDKMINNGSKSGSEITYGNVLFQSLSTTSTEQIHLSFFDKSKEQTSTAYPTNAQNYKRTNNLKQHLPTISRTPLITEEANEKNTNLDDFLETLHQTKILVDEEKHMPETRTKSLENNTTLKVTTVINDRVKGNNEKKIKKGERGSRIKNAKIQLNKISTPLMTVSDHNNLITSINIDGFEQTTAFTEAAQLARSFEIDGKIEKVITSTPSPDYNYLTSNNNHDHLKHVINSTLKEMKMYTPSITKLLQASKMRTTATSKTLKELSNNTFHIAVINKNYSNTIPSQHLNTWNKNSIRSNDSVNIMLKKSSSILEGKKRLVENSFTAEIKNKINNTNEFHKIDFTMTTSPLSSMFSYIKNDYGKNKEMVTSIINNNTEAITNETNHIDNLHVLNDYPLTGFGPITLSSILSNESFPKFEVKTTKVKNLSLTKCMPTESSRNSTLLPLSLSQLTKMVESTAEEQKIFNNYDILRIMNTTPYSFLNTNKDLKQSENTTIALIPKNSKAVTDRNKTIQRFGSANLMENVSRMKLPKFEDKKGSVNKMFLIKRAKSASLKWSSYYKILIDNTTDSQNISDFTIITEPSFFVSRDLKGKMNITEAMINKDIRAVTNDASYMDAFGDKRNCTSTTPQNFQSVNFFPIKPLGTIKPLSVSSRNIFSKFIEKPATLKTFDHSKMVHYTTDDLGEYSKSNFIGTTKPAYSLVTTKKDLQKNATMTEAIINKNIRVITNGANYIDSYRDNRDHVSIKFPKFRSSNPYSNKTFDTTNSIRIRSKNKYSSIKGKEKFVNILISTKPAKSEPLQTFNHSNLVQNKTDSQEEYLKSDSTRTAKPAYSLFTTIKDLQVYTTTTEAMMSVTDSADHIDNYIYNRDYTSTTSSNFQTSIPYTNKTFDTTNSIRIRSKNKYLTIKGSEKLVKTLTFTKPAISELLKAFSYSNFVPNIIDGQRRHRNQQPTSDHYVATMPSNLFSTTKKDLKRTKAIIGAIIDNTSTIEVINKNERSVTNGANFIDIDIFAEKLKFTSEKPQKLQSSNLSTLKNLNSTDSMSKSLSKTLRFKETAISHKPFTFTKSSTLKSLHQLNFIPKPIHKNSNFGQKGDSLIHNEVTASTVNNSTKATLNNPNQIDSSGNILYITSVIPQNFKSSNMNALKLFGTTSSRRVLSKNKVSKFEKEEKVNKTLTILRISDSLNPFGPSNGTRKLLPLYENLVQNTTDSQRGYNKSVLNVTTTPAYLFYIANKDIKQNDIINKNLGAITNGAYYVESLTDKKYFTSVTPQNIQSSNSLKTSGSVISIKLFNMSHIKNNISEKTTIRNISHANAYPEIFNLNSKDLKKNTIDHITSKDLHPIFNFKILKPASQDKINYTNKTNIDVNNVFIGSSKYLYSSLTPTFGFTDTDLKYKPKNIHYIKKLNKKMPLSIFQIDATFIKSSLPIRKENYYFNFENNTTGAIENETKTNILKAYSNITNHRLYTNTATEYLTTTSKNFATNLTTPAHYDKIILSKIIQKTTNGSIVNIYRNALYSTGPMPMFISNTYNKNIPLQQQKSQNTLLKNFSSITKPTKTLTVVAVNKNTMNNYQMSEILLPLEVHDKNNLKADSVTLYNASSNNKFIRDKLDNDLQNVDLHQNNNSINLIETINIAQKSFHSILLNNSLRMRGNIPEVISESYRLAKTTPSIAPKTKTNKVIYSNSYHISYQKSLPSSYIKHESSKYPHTTTKYSTVYGKNKSKMINNITRDSVKDTVRLTTQHLSRTPILTTTKKVRVIKYNTYAPKETDFPLINPFFNTRKTSIANKNIYKNMHEDKYINLHHTPVVHVINKTTSITRQFESRKFKDNSDIKLKSHVFKNKFRKTETNMKPLLDPFEKTKLYPVKMMPSHPQRKTMKRIKIGHKNREVITMNSYDFFSQKRFTPQKNEAKDIPILHRQPLQRNIHVSPGRRQYSAPKFDESDVDGVKKYFRPKPLFINKEDFYKEVFQGHHKSGFSSRDKVNYVRENIIPPVTEEADSTNILDRPEYHQPLPNINKPKFLRDRIDSIRNYLNIVDVVKTTYNPVKNYFMMHTSDNSDGYQSQEATEFYYNNGGWMNKDTLPTTVATTKRKRRSRRTLFFLSPTAPYRRYF